MDVRLSRVLPAALLATGTLGCVGLLGLDQARFASELQARTHRAHVAREVDGGLKSGVTGTPTLFINGKRHVGTWEGGSLLRALGGAPAMARSAHL